MDEKQNSALATAQRMICDEGCSPEELAKWLVDEFQDKIIKRSTAIAALRMLRAGYKLEIVKDEIEAFLKWESDLKSLEKKTVQTDFLTQGNNRKLLAGPEK